MKKFLLIVLLTFSSPALANTITINEYNPGGMVDDFIAFWKMIAASGDSVVINAPCASACTFFLGFIAPEKVCVTSKASLGFHEAHNSDGPAIEYTKAFYRAIYPGWVQKWISDKGGLTEEALYMWPEDMKGHINLCPGSTYSDVPAEKLINSPEHVPLDASSSIKETIIKPNG